MDLYKEIVFEILLVLISMISLHILIFTSNTFQINAQLIICFFISDNSWIIGHGNIISRTHFSRVFL